MKSEKTQPLRDEIDPLSEAVEIENRISLSNQEALGRDCFQTFEKCPKAKHRDGNCRHRVDCVNRKVLD